MIGMVITAQTELRELVDLAITRAGWPQKEAAFRAGMDASNFSRALHGDGDLGLRRLERFPQDFWDEFVPLLAKRYGFELVAREDRQRATRQRLRATLEALAATLGEID